MSKKCFICNFEISKEEDVHNFTPEESTFMLTSILDLPDWPNGNNFKKLMFQSVCYCSDCWNQILEIWNQSKSENLISSSNYKSESGLSGSELLESLIWKFQILTKLVETGQRLAQVDSGSGSNGRPVPMGMLQKLRLEIVNEILSKGPLIDPRYLVLESKTNQNEPVKSVSSELKRKRIRKLEEISQNFKRKKTENQGGDDDDDEDDMVVDTLELASPESTFLNSTDYCEPDVPLIEICDVQSDFEIPQVSSEKFSEEFAGGSVFELPNDIENEMDSKKDPSPEPALKPRPKPIAQNTPTRKSQRTPAPPRSAMKIYLFGSPTAKDRKQEMAKQRKTKTTSKRPRANKKSNAKTKTSTSKKPDKTETNAKRPYVRKRRDSGTSNQENEIPKKSRVKSKRRSSEDSSKKTKKSNLSKTPGQTSKSSKLKKKKPKKQTKCLQCGKQLSRPIYLKSHTKLYHLDPKFKCPYEYCKFGAPIRPPMRAHLTTSHKNESTQVCLACFKIFSSKITLEFHHQQSESCKLRIDNGFKQNPHQKSKPKKCEHCDQMLPSIAAWKRHLLHEHSITLYKQCTKCDFKCINFKEFITHKKMHKEKEDEEKLKEEEMKNIKCDLCSAKFKLEQNLIEHKLLHTEDHENFKCDKCYGKFIHLRAKIEHVKICTGSVQESQKTDVDVQEILVSL